MNTNRKNRAKRTIAAILAALTVMTATVPTIAGAEEFIAEQDTIVIGTMETTEAPTEAFDVTETETEPETDAVEETADPVEAIPGMGILEVGSILDDILKNTEETEPATEAETAPVKKHTYDELVANAMEEIEGKTLEEALQYWVDFQKKPVATFGNEILPPAEMKEQEEALEDVVRELCAKALTEAIVTAMKAGCGEGAGVAASPVEKAVNYMLGVQGDASNDEVMKKIDVQTSELINAMQVSQQGMLSTITDTSAAIQIGEKLNEFDNKAAGMTNSIASIYSTIANNRLYPTENDKIVATAALLGSLKNYDNIELKLCETNAYDLITTPGNSIDPEGRTLFEIGYHMAGNESMFKGEAIDRSAPFIRKNINNYVSNALVLINLLDAQTKVSRFTEDDVNALSAKAREDYDTICDYMDDAAGYQKDLILKLTDKENGILSMTTNYLSQKDRTTFIYKNRKGFTPVKLMPTFQHITSSFLVTSPKSITGNVEFYDARYKSLYNKSQLTAAQVKDICAHACSACCELDSRNRNIKGYLEAVGFEFDNITSKRADGSPIIVTDKYTTWSQSWWSSGWIGLNGYRINGRGGYQAGFIRGNTDTHWIDTTREEGDAFDFLFFQAYPTIIINGTVTINK